METTQYKSFTSLMNEIDSEKREQRDRGTLFELLVKAYLSKEPMYARLFDRVWMLNEVPEKYGIPKKDTGVDLVTRIRGSQKLIAVQCKYYNKNKKIDKKDIDSFLGQVGKSYYSEGLIVSSTDNWTENANNELIGRSKPITRIGLSELQESKIDWSEYSFSEPEEIKLKAKKVPRQHQIPAIDAVLHGFETNNRGKLIMAPGTGKTYTSMAIMEEMAKNKGSDFRVLYLVPSIQLLSQSLRGWTGDTNFEMDTIAVCSDRKVTKKVKGESELEDIAAADLGYPATTSYEKLLDYQRQIEDKENHIPILAVFSTYQSIDVVIEAQQNGFYEFDLVICDEAHRTTGATELGKEASSFTKVHSDNNIIADKRLYQTATPRIYGEQVRKKASEMSVVVSDMNDKNIYGEEFYRIGFGDAVNRGILTDYKVMILAVDENMVARQFQKMMSENGELKFDDVTKIIGCWNGLIKRKSKSNTLEGAPMKRAIAFTGTIKESKMMTNMFNQVVDNYINDSGNQSNPMKVQIDHADGSMNALQKNEKINWLKSDVPDNTCRILSNARFLTEGVDIPDLDAIMFLKPRKSKIDIAQAVGRVMRKSPGKEYGYVILPIGIPEGIDENQVLDNNDKYRVVWEVLNALRSLDERFDATINKLELNKSKPTTINVIGVGEAPEDGYDGFIVNNDVEQLELLTESEWSNIERAIFGKIVKKVGNVRYWDDWSKDVAKIAQQHIMRINIMLEDRTSYVYEEFYSFFNSLRHNINESISEQEVIEMLAQHMITKPVFDALFDQESFVKNNPVSQAMDEMIMILEKLGLSKEQEDLNGFYASVRTRAEGIDNIEAKQDIIMQLYNKFFKVGFPITTDKLGIVFTPIEVVDFIIHSIEDALKKYFDTSITNEGVNILDPFTGTGTFITRLLQSGVITKEDMFRKYTEELHANEIVLLSYYIAAINIEETFNMLMETEQYNSFDGIVLTDTFETTEQEDTLDDTYFGDNDLRVKKQKELPITVILGNPPYSVGAKDENKSHKNKKYKKLELSIEKTYAKYTDSKSKRGLYDSYIKAFRWASDRIGDRGVIGYITNNSFIDVNSMEGVRYCWSEEFNYIYVFNLRGAIRQKVGEEARKEGQNIFDIMTGVAITLLIKDGSDNHEIFYHDIGTYLSKKQKLDLIEEYSSVKNIDFQVIKPDKNNNWINQGDEKFSSYSNILGDVFYKKTDGIQSNRDSWVFNYSQSCTIKNGEHMINNYNLELDRLIDVPKKDKVDALNTEDTFVSWSRGLKKKITNGQRIDIKDSPVMEAFYRPFTKKYLYYDSDIIEYPRKFNDIFSKKNKMISITGIGAQRDFSAIVIDKIPEYKFMENGRHFYLYDNSDMGSIDYQNTDNIVDLYKDKLNMNSEDTFAYIYAILNSPEYKLKYDNNLRKELPRIPILKNTQKYLEIGHKLVNIHLNYEKFYDKTSEVVVDIEKEDYIVKKMKFIKNKKSIVFNDNIIISNIPEKAYKFMVNGKSAIEWIVDQYQYKENKKTKIIDDPNMYSDDSKYVFHLLLSIIEVSLQTVDLINSFPPLEILE